jgi:hypothetical protein
VFWTSEQTMEASRKPTEIIESSEVLERGAVLRVETRGEIIRVKASMWFVGATLAIAVAVLLLAILRDRNDLQTWATGLISGISGAAIGFGLNDRRNG